ncbi:MAG: hypothetical protein NY202_05525 [Mollicutes bacterium UO1]
MAVGKINFFCTKSNRERYYDIYNYYILSPANSSYCETHLLNKLDSHYESELSQLARSPNVPHGKIMDMAVQGLENVRKFLLNYE